MGGDVVCGLREALHTNEDRCLAPFGSNEVAGGFTNSLGFGSQEGCSCFQSVCGLVEFLGGERTSSTQVAC